MANMSTHIQRSWDRLVGAKRDASLVSVDDFRTWITSDLVKTSRLLQSRLGEAQDDPIWRRLFGAPMAEFPVRVVAWQEFVKSLRTVPPSFNPEALWDWAQGCLWQLLVFIDPGEACDLDQYDLEVWWSESEQLAAFVCGVGHQYVFRRRGTHKPYRWTPLFPWASAEVSDLAPASRDIVERLFSDKDLLLSR